MSRARFHVFSGTGNSRHLGQAISARLQSRGFDCDLREVTAEAWSHRLRSARAGVERDGGDLDLFLFPVYAMAVPRIMNRHMRSLGRPLLVKDAPGTAAQGGGRPRAALLSTNGRISDRLRDGHEGQALAQAERILARLGWDVVYRETFDYPQSITTILPAQDEGRRARIMGALGPKLDAAADDLAAGRRKKRPCSLLFHLVGWPFGWLYRLFGRRAWGKLFAADERCDGCGLCASRCPARAISMTGGRPRWSYACEGCERCMNLCPKRAIQTSLLRLAIIAALSVGVLDCPLRAPLAAALSALPPALFEACWLAAATAGIFVALALADLALVGLSRIPALRPFLAFGWTRWTRRYPDPSAKDLP